MKCRNCNKNYPSKFYFVENNPLSVCIYCKNKIEKFREEIESETNLLVEKEKNLSIFINKVLKIPEIKRIRLIKNWYIIIIFILYFVFIFIIKDYKDYFRIAITSSFGFIWEEILSLILFLIILSPFYFIYTRIIYSGISKIFLNLGKLDFMNQLNFETDIEVSNSKKLSIFKFLKKRKIFESKITNNQFYIYLRNDLFKPFVLKLPTGENQIEIFDNCTMNVIGKFDSLVEENLKNLFKVVLYKAHTNDYDFFNDLKKLKIKNILPNLIS